MPAIPDLEKIITDILGILVKPMKWSEILPGGRDRLLCLPILIALMLCLVLRNVASYAELLKILSRERILWIASPLSISAAALTKRIRKLPLETMSNLLTQVLIDCSAKIRGDPRWAPLKARFSRVTILDGTTTEALCKRLGEKPETSDSWLAGRWMFAIDFWTRLPRHWRWTDNANANDKALLDASWFLPGELLIMDMGFYSFGWFDTLTRQGVGFLTRLRAKSAFTVVKTLQKSGSLRDQLIQVGKYSSHPCETILRLIEVEYAGVWYQYLTNQLNPKELPAEVAVWFYRRRWRIEDMFLAVKQVLGVWRLWGCDRHAAQIQWYSTLIIYAVFETCCDEVGNQLGVPPDQISREMVFRGQYHYDVYVRQGGTLDFCGFLVTDWARLELVKKRRTKAAGYLSDPPVFDEIP